MSRMIWTPADPDLPPVTVTVQSQEALLNDLRRHIAARSGFAVATLNLDHVVKLKQDRRFHAAYAEQTHVTADGRPIVWLSRWARQPVDLVTGSDLVAPMFALCAELSVPIALFGSTTEILSKARGILEQDYPGLDVAAAIAPPMGFDPISPQADALLKDIAASGARLCFIALGAPKQELLAARARAAHPHLGFLSIGASIDFIVGAQKRAPWIFRTLAAEWLWRLMQDPRRLAARYMACFALLPRLILRALRTRRSTAPYIAKQGGTS